MTEARPRVSVILPCYNGACYLREALDSLFCQTRPPDEVLFIDDGSTDASASIAKHYGAEHSGAPRIICLRQENQGIGAARNRGLGQARGELIAFLDADDRWPPESLAVRLRHLDARPDWDGVFGLVDCFITPEMPDALRATLWCPPMQAARMAGSLLIRRRVFERVGGFDVSLQVGEMIDWLARAGEQGMQFGAVETLVLRRRIHGANTVLNSQRLQADYLRLLRATLQRRRNPAGGLDSAPT